MKRITFAIAFLVGLHGHAFAQGVNVYDFGRVSCGYWLETRAASSNPNDTRFLQAREWMMGFITAYNWYISPDGDVVKGIDRPGMYAWLDQYCRENPTVGFVKAVEQLINHLEGR